MKRAPLSVLLLCAVAVCPAVFLRLRRASSGMIATITPQILVRGAIPFGINLGSWTFWGAEQLMSNIVKNPGFEGLIDGAIVQPVHSGEGNFDDSPAWLARPDAFWEGAHYSIRTGPKAGLGGIISHSSAKNIFGLPSFTVEGNGPMPQPAEAVSVTKVREDALPTQWWFSKDPANSFSPENNQKSPESPGVRSLRVSAGSYRPAEVASYFDTIGERAGKLLPLIGKWTLSFWAKLDRGQASLRALVGRDGSQPVLAQSVGLTTSWKKFALPFDAGDDDGPPRPVSLRFQVAGGPAGDVLLDDVDLRRDSDANFPFRNEVVSTLEALHPSYLRDWQGQLGDTFTNRTATSFARKAWRYRPGDDTQTDFGYGLDDFLELSKKVGAAPWIVIPSVFNDDDCSKLGSWLASSGHLLSGREVLVEFGNENWNELFRPAGIADPVVHGKAADRCFAAIRSDARGIRLKTVINAQFANAARVVSYGSESQAADIVAVAPYFARSLTHGLPALKRDDMLFESTSVAMRSIASDVAGLHKELAVYEVNLHTVSGTASEAERRPVVAGIASGTALARTLLDSLAHGMRRQCVYTFTGFDTALQTVPGHTPLWGIVRDVRERNRFRPTGLALQLLNDTVRGNMHNVDLEGTPDVWVYAFESGGSISVVALSGSAERRHIVVKYPDGREATAGLRLLSLSSLSTDSTNEETAEVTVKPHAFVLSGQTASFDIEPWGMVVLRLGSRGS